MVARSTRPAENVREVAKLALNDAVEITLLIALLRGKTTGGVNERLTKAGAGGAANVVENALIARLVMLIARAYPEPKHGDLHLRRAVCLLTDNTTRQVFASANHAEKLSTFDAQWKKCRGDHRLPLIKEFRDKYTAHLGEPAEIKEATYKDIFEFGAATSKAMEMLALSTGIAEKPIDRDPGLVTSPEAFWAPWKHD